jgi:hypothetical protein
MLEPGWLLLVWSGAAATAAAAVAGSVLGGRGGSWLLLSQGRRRSTAVTLSMLAGILGYPALYGLAFEALGRADVPAGLLLGLVHGAVVFAAARPLSRPGPAARLATIHMVYGTALGFLYVTP